MSSDLKKLVLELEKVLNEQGGLIDAPVREMFNVKIDSISKAISEADTVEKKHRLGFDLINATAAILTIITNVMMILK